MAKAASANDTTNMTATTEVAEAPVTEGTPVRRANAPVCPVHAPHANTGVYKTKGSIQYCKCDDCGHTWRRTRPTDAVGGVSQEVMVALADSLEAAPQISYGNSMVVVIPIEDAKRTIRRIRELCQA